MIDYRLWIMDYGVAKGDDLKRGALLCKANRHPKSKIQNPKFIGVSR
jgi:hypothetical protein